MFIFVAMLVVVGVVAWVRFQDKIKAVVSALIGKFKTKAADAKASVEVAKAKAVDAVGHVKAEAKAEKAEVKKAVEDVKADVTK